MNTSDRFAGWAVIVTGGASGMGAACVEQFVNGGADVVIVDRSADNAAAVAARLRDQQHHRGRQVRREPRKEVAHRRADRAAEQVHPQHQRPAVRDGHRAAPEFGQELRRRLVQGPQILRHQRRQQLADPGDDDAHGLEQHPQPLRLRVADQVQRADLAQQAPREERRRLISIELHQPDEAAGLLRPRVDLLDQRVEQRRRLARARGPLDGVGAGPVAEEAEDDIIDRGPSDVGAHAPRS